MTRALVAVAKSQVASMADRLHLPDNGLVHLGVALVVNHGRRAGIDRRGVHAILDDAMAFAAVEGKTAVMGTQL